MDYTLSKIKEILKELRIEPLRSHMVDGQQAAQILTWRLKQEQGIDHTYTTTALRRRVNTGALPVAEQVNIRLNLYDVRDVFKLSLMPQRAEGTRKRLAKKDTMSATT